MNRVIEAFQFQFMQNAVLAGFLVSIACGVIGALVVVNRIVFISGGIAHAAYGGVGLAFFLGLPVFPCTMAYSLAIAAIMAWLIIKKRHRSDTIIGVLWAMGMASGVILLDLTPGYHADIMSFLFGSILAVSQWDLLLMLLLDVLILGLIVLFYKPFLAISYDEEFAKVRGISVGFFQFILLALVACTVVMTIRVVGLILVIALITIPQYIVERFSGSVARMMFFSTILSALFVLTGLFLSYRFNLTSGATIIAVAGVSFFIFNIITSFMKWPHRF